MEHKRIEFYTDINNIEIYMTMQTKVIQKYDYPGL